MSLMNFSSTSIYIANAHLRQFNELIKDFPDKGKYESITIKNTIIDFNDVINHVTNCIDCNIFKFQDNIFSKHDDLRRFLPSYVFPCGNTLEEIFINKETETKDLIDFWDMITSEIIVNAENTEETEYDDTLEYKTIQASFLVNRKYESVRNDPDEKLIFLPSNLLPIFFPKYDSFEKFDKFIKSVNLNLQEMVNDQASLNISSEIQQISNMIDYPKLDQIVQKFIFLKKISLDMQSERILSNKFKTIKGHLSLSNMPQLININEHSIKYYPRCIKEQIKEMDKQYDNRYKLLTEFFETHNFLREIDNHIKILNHYQIKFDLDDRLLINDYLTQSANKHSPIIYLIDAGMHEIIIHFANSIIKQIMNQINRSIKQTSVDYWQSKNDKFRKTAWTKLRSLFTMIKVIETSINLIFLLDQIYDLIEKAAVKVKQNENY